MTATHSRLFLNKFLNAICDKIANDNLTIAEIKMKIGDLEINDSLFLDIDEKFGQINLEADSFYFIDKTQKPRKLKKIIKKKQIVPELKEPIVPEIKEEPIVPEIKEPIVPEIKEPIVPELKEEPIVEQEKVIIEKAPPKRKIIKKNETNEKMKVKNIDIETQEKPSVKKQEQKHKQTQETLTEKELIENFTKQINLSSEVEKELPNIPPKKKRIVKNDDTNEFGDENEPQQEIIYDKIINYEEDELVLHRKKFNGVNYLVDDNNFVYNEDGSEIVGKLSDVDKEKIIFLKDLKELEFQ